MSWLRIDDGFTKHPKFTGWPPARKWAWVELLCHCAKHETGGYVSEDLAVLPRAVTRNVISHAIKSGLLDRTSDGRLKIHDWVVYNGTTEEKVDAYLAGHPESSANDVHKAVGGQRDLVLQLVREYRASRFPGTTNGTTLGGSQSGSRARAPRPHPLPQQEPSVLPPERKYAEDGRTDEDPGYTQADLEALAAATLEDMPA